jgi:tRNA threonylcarbamoyl adenosine modification protein (Sua5/YciO/YrdC/YwlC family)
MLVLKDPAADSSELEFARRALARGELVVVPTDTVYGVAASAEDEAAVVKLYAAKGRDLSQPSAALFATVRELRAAFGEDGMTPRATWAVESLLPGPWTLVVSNPAAKWPWLTGGRAGDPIGVRVPAGALALPPIAATSANPAGEATATCIAEVDPELAAFVACAIDRGPLGSGADASTILDLTVWERSGDSADLRIIRDDAGRAGVARAALLSAP